MGDPEFFKNKKIKPQYGRLSLSMAEKVKKIKFNGKASVWQKKWRKSNSMVKPQYGRKSEENQIQWLSLSMAEKVKKIIFND